MSKDENNKVKEAMEEVNEDLFNPSLVQDNKLHFHNINILYRVTLPTQRILAEAEEMKNAYNIELIQKPNTMTKKRLKKVLKEKQDIDIDAMQKSADVLELTLIDLYISLAKCKDSEEKHINSLKKKIKEVSDNRLDIVLEIAEYLAPTIQNQVTDKYMEYLTSTCTEKCVEEKDKSGKVTERWDKVWNSWDEFQEDNTKVALKALRCLTELLMNVQS